VLGVVINKIELLQKNKNKNKGTRKSTSFDEESVYKDLNQIQYET